MKSIMYVLAIMTVLYGCKTYAPTTDENPDCKTVVSGNIFFDVRTKWKAPALVIKVDGRYKFLHGRILEKKDDGYMFAPEVTNKFDREREPRLYNWKEIVLLMDSSKTILYGAIPEEYNNFWTYDWCLIPESAPSSPIHLKMKSNQPFSYCLEPGNYTVRNIIFINNRIENYSDISLNASMISFGVKKNLNNYIGDIHYDTTGDSTDIHNIYCYPLNRNDNSPIFVGTNNAWTGIKLLFKRKPLPPKIRC